MKRRTAASTFSRVSNDCFSFFHFKDAIWTEFKTARFSSFGAAITFIRKNYGKQGFPELSKVITFNFSV